MIRRTSILLALLLVMCSGINAATPEIIPDSVTSESSAKMRFSVEVDKKLTKGLHLSVEQEFRLKNMTDYGSGVNHFDRSYTGLELSYKTCDYLKVGLGYAFLAYYKDGKSDTNNSRYWSLRHRVFLNVTGNYKYNQWKFSLRVRPEVTIRTDSLNKLEKNKAEWLLRTRFMASYEFPNKPIELFGYVELFNTLNAINPNKTIDKVYALSGQVNPGTVQCKWDGQYIDDVRASVGLNYRLDKRNELKFYYRFDYSVGRDIHLNANYANNFKEFTLTKEKGYYHTLGVGYSYSF